MILATYSTQPGGERKPGVVKNGRVYALPYTNMQAVIEAGAETAAQNISSTPIHIAHVQFHAPLQPVSLRDGYAFEQHVKTANANRGRDVPPEWYKFPVFYFSNAGNIFGPNDEIPCPSYTSELDYELEIAAVIGRGGRDVPAEAAVRHIFGFTVFNDWSARDVQRDEMIVGLGPAKGKDFASSLGPYLVTIDELAERATMRPGIFDMPMIARVNGSELSRGNMKDMYWSFGDIIAR
ncbi:MAG TPA: fumarylacetoacetate hydrolase family protein, partial [Anaerolineales bacterium]